MMKNLWSEELEDRAIVRIAAHLPDLIVYGNFLPGEPSVDYFHGVLMFVDISGMCGELCGIQRHHSQS